MNEEWIQTYDQKLEMWGSLLLTLQDCPLEKTKQALWNEMWENWKTCHQWLTQLENGQGLNRWKEEIEQGVRCLELDWEQFKA